MTVLTLDMMFKGRKQSLPWCYPQGIRTPTSEPSHKCLTLGWNLILLRKQSQGQPGMWSMALPHPRAGRISHREGKWWLPKPVGKVLKLNVMNFQNPKQLSNMNDRTTNCSCLIFHPHVVRLPYCYRILWQRSHGHPLPRAFQAGIILSLSPSLSPSVPRPLP